MPAVTTEVSGTTLYEAADFSLPLTVVDENGDAVDITGATFACSFRWQYADADAEIELTSGSGIAITTAASGIYTLTITDAQTGAVTFPAALTGLGGSVFSIFFDVMMTLGGVVTQVHRGTAQFYRSATR